MQYSVQRTENCNSNSVTIFPIEHAHEYVLLLSDKSLCDKSSCHAYHIFVNLLVCNKLITEFFFSLTKCSPLKTF